MTRALGMELVESWCDKGLGLGSGDARTLASADDTNSFAMLVRRAVQAFQPAVVLDVGCGCGIPTVEAAHSGAARVLGIDVLPANVTLSRTNAALAGFEDRVAVSHVSWQQAVSGELDVGAVELVVANPPYLPAASGLAVDGGIDGTRMLRAIIDGVPEKASTLALLFGSLSNPLAVLERLASTGWSVQSMFAHAVRFGRYTSAPGCLQTLHRLQNEGLAFFCETSAPDDAKLAPHAYLVLGVVARRTRPPHRLVDSVAKLMHAFRRHGVSSLDDVRMPVPFEAASYFATPT